ncbi:hypothetical protein [Arcicella aurantiaca]|nr:hypothetical protein [Arcicella aurantiaca]
MNTKFYKIFKTLCLMLSLHLLAMNICDNYYLKLIGQTSKSGITKNVDLEEEEADANGKTSESDSFDDIDDDYLVESFFSYNAQINHESLVFLPKQRFHFFSVILPQLHYDIQIPPPRA